tara:strand:+ start:2101 stop:2472 length:372 start_codon:yes stop_codon:yes gene_type:complete
MDGYPEGHGHELATFLNQFTMVNGIVSTETRKTANGEACLAAQAVAHFKGSQVGNFYLHAAGTKNVGEEYVYHVRTDDDGIHISCEHWGTFFFGMGGEGDGEKKEVFSGTPQMWLDWLRVNLR